MAVADAAPRDRGKVLKSTEEEFNERECITQAEKTVKENQQVEKSFRTLV